MKKITFLLKVSDYYYLIFTENGVYLNKLYIFLIKTKEDSTQIIKDIFIKSAIKINNYLFAFISNRIVSKGKEKLFFFNFSTRQIIYTIENYSFTLTNNGMMVMQFGEEKEKNNKINILLCACKKYIKSQKNGILLVKIDNQNNFNYAFCATKNFEVFCFCKLMQFEKISILSTESENDVMDTNYFLVGGFDKDKGKGAIKLYKIINVKEKDNRHKTKIKFIDNIINNFKGPISCIIQSNNGSKISATCWDGNVYSFDKQNINDYLERDKLSKKKIQILLNI
jgi:WD40 repeat protein